MLCWGEFYCGGGRREDRYRDENAQRKRKNKKECSSPTPASYIGCYAVLFFVNVNVKMSANSAHGPTVSLFQVRAGSEASERNGEASDCDLFKKQMEK